MSVGLFLIVACASFFYLAVFMDDIDWHRDDFYVLKARFVSASGLRQGANVEIAGVVVGSVKGIEFDPENYLAVVAVKLSKKVRIQEDAIASIRSTGIIGAKFITITPGGSPAILKDGDEIMETESSINLEEMISQYIFKQPATKSSGILP